MVGFPLGASPTSSKVDEARRAADGGASELDMVANLGALREGDLCAVHDDIRAVVSAAEAHPVKVILESGLITRRELVVAALLAVNAGARFLKTSTGFAYTRSGSGYLPLGATTGHVSLLRALGPHAVGVKASGGIRTFDDAAALVRAGASRLGASASLAIVSAA